MPEPGTGPPAVTNPLPDWYVNSLESYRRWADRTQAEQQRALTALAARGAEVARPAVHEETSPALEGAGRGPLGLRIRLRWMRLWLPSERTYRRRNRALVVCISCTVPCQIVMSVLIFPGGWWWRAPLGIVLTVLATMTITRSWRADPATPEGR